MRALHLLALAGFAPLLSGCIAGAVADVVTAPVRIGARAVDLATTSQSEADRNRGREIRRREERLAQLEELYLEQREECENGDEDACEEARATYQEMQELLPTIPVERDDG